MNSTDELGTRSALPKPPANDGGSLVRLTVNLVPRAAAALQRACELTGDTKTDVVNRALQSYALLQELSDLGGGSVTLLNADGEKVRIHIL